MMNEINIVDEFASLVAAKVVEMLKESGMVMAASAAAPTRNSGQIPTLYTVDEVRERVKVSKATLYRHINDGLIKPSHYVGKSPRFTDDDILKYLLCFNDE